MKIRVEVINGRKKCSLCKEFLEIHKFRKNTTLACGLHSQCNTCERKGRNKHRSSKSLHGITFQKIENIRKFGISIEKYLRMIDDQNNKCAICNNMETVIDFRSKNIKKLSIDHCHITNQVRGLLCSACNTALGLFKDDTEILEKAIKYLKEKE